MTIVNVVGGGGGGSSGVYTSNSTSGTVYITSSGTGYPGGAGSSGSYLTSGTGISGTQWSNNINANIKITGNNPTLSTEKNDINLDELADLIKILKERLLIIVPDFEKHEKYSALKKAYDHYKLIEAMIQEEKK